MRTYRNHTIVNAAQNGSSICVAGQTMRSLPLYPVCLMGTLVQLRQRDQSRHPDCAGKQRCEISLQSEKSERSFPQGRTSDLSLAGSGLRFAS